MGKPRFRPYRFDEVQITTRSTLGQVAESRVSNLYVFLFDQNGNRVAGHFFDNSNKRDSHSSVISANVNCWMVDNQLSSTEPKTTGTIRMKVPQLTGGEICIVANLDTDISASRPKCSVSSRPATN